MGASISAPLPKLEHKMDDRFSLAGKVAIVTGGGSGIGAVSAQLLASRGAKVAVAGRRVAELGNTVAAITRAGGSAIAVETDVAEDISVAALVTATVAAFGRLDLVHGNAALTDPAGMGRDMLIADLDVATWDRTLAVNLRGSALLAKYSIPHLLAAGGGAIVFSGSAKGAQGDIEYPAYGASKAGLESLSRYIATQYGKQGLRCNVVAIGLVMTEALDTNMPAAVQKLLLEHHLTPALGRAEDIARAVAFLLSDEACFITGATIPVDGGVTSHSPIFADMLRMAAAQGAH
jgi:NAD(P)-dependent dehydrogenase (short-subunit alcohol dehydrogenase family)